MCTGLVSMQSMGLGGGHVATVYVAAERRAHTLNARERAPAADETKTHSAEADSIGVPGELRGYGELHRRFGRVPWPDLWQPTLRLCREGFVMSRHMADFVHSDFEEDRHLG